MTNLRYALLALGIAAAAASSAQGLKKEITVQHDVVPEAAEVSKLQFTPALTLPQLQRPQLDYSTRSVFASVAPSITTLGPAAWADSIYTSPYKGYAVLGFAPMYNLNASAGYKFIDNDRTRFNAMLQYNGTAYKGRCSHSLYDGQYQRSNTVTAALGLHHALSDTKFLDFAADYTFGRYTTPATIDSTGRQQMHRFNFDALFSGGGSALSYGAGLGAGYFSYVFSPDYLLPYSLADGSVEWERMHPAHETKANINGYVASAISAHQRAGVDLDFNLLSNSRHAHAGYDYDNEEYYLGASPRHTHALLTIAPYYHLRTSAVELRAGVKAQLSINSGKALHIAPDAILSWRPVSVLALYARAGGGEWQNTLTSLFDVSPYTLSGMAFKNSHVPITAEGGITFGPLRGASVEVSWRYAAANEWLMPVTLDDGLTIFNPTKMRGYLLHAGLTYEYGDAVELRTSFEMAPQSANRGYYLWRDRAKSAA